MLKTAPTPVIAAQPIRAATSRSVPSGSSTACVAGTTTCSAKHAVGHEVAEVLAARPQARAAVGHAVEVRADLAQRRRAGCAHAAAAAGGHPRERDRIAHLRRQHAGPDGVDDARALVAEHHRQVVRPGAVHDVEVGAADAGGGDAHAHLARLRLAELDLLDAQRSAGLPQDRGPREHAQQEPRERCGGRVRPMSRRLVAGLVALIAVGGVFAFGLSKQDDVSRIDTKNVTVPPAGFQTFAAAAITGHGVRRQAVLARAACEGKPVFINFWGSWCAPCRREAPGAAQVPSALGGRASFVGVAVESPHAEAVAFARKAGWRYPIVSTRCCDLDDRYGVVVHADDDRRRQQGPGRRPPDRPADARAADTPSCTRSAPSRCPSSRRSPSRRSGSAPPSPPA